MAYFRSGLVTSSQLPQVIQVTQSALQIHIIYQGLFKRVLLIHTLKCVVLEAYVEYFVEGM